MSKPTTRHWEQMKKFQRQEQQQLQHYRAPNQGIFSFEEIEVVLTHGKLEERIDRSSKRLKKREYFNKLKQKADDDPEKKANKIGRKERAAQNSAVTKLFGSGELIDVQLPDEDCNISGW
jgi:hypothetical protein